VETRRVRAALRALAERGRGDQAGPGRELARAAALTEINRVLGRAVGTRRAVLCRGATPLAAS
jgi:hypothetical protein